MKEQIPMTNEQRNIEHFKKMGEVVAKRQQATQERYEKLSNGFGKAMAQYDVNELTNTANGLLSGEINAKNFAVEKAIEFSGQCRTAISSLEKKLLRESTTAGLLSHQGKSDAYRNKMQEIEGIKSQIQLFKTFI